ncbi:MAG: RecX family transcriptional regulator [Clostridia bacterium]|nr:RecX family transcriptional regulator [Clostridia bacterium]
MIITKIEKAKKKDRVNLFVDDEFYASISVETVYTCRLKKGAELSREELDYIIGENERNLAFNQALLPLSKTMKTRSQIESYLSEKGFGEQAVSYAVEKLEKCGYIDDRQYVSLYISLNKNRCGTRRISAELNKKGIADDVASEGMADISEDEQISGAKAIAEKFLRDKEVSRENLLKLNRRLLYKGYGYDLVKKVLDYYKNNDSEDFDC